MKRGRNITEIERRRKAAAFTLAELPVVSRRGSKAFTLAELLVVIGVIALALGIVVPSLHGLFNARTDREAEGTLGAMLILARGTAIENQTYALLHGGTGVNGDYWVAVFFYERDRNKFVPGVFTCSTHRNVRLNKPGKCPSCSKVLGYEGLVPQQIAGHMGFGEVSDRYVSNSSYRDTVNSDWDNFGAFNIIFASDGSLTTTVDGNPPVFDIEHAIFTGAPKIKVWSATANAARLSETGVRAVTVYEHKLLKIKPDKRAYLETNGRFIVVNPYTGQLIEDEVE